MERSWTVTEEQCAEMRRLAEETSFTHRTIAHVVFDEPIHKHNVGYHVHGECTHFEDG